MIFFKNYLNTFSLFSIVFFFSAFQGNAQYENHINPNWKQLEGSASDIVVGINGEVYIIAGTPMVDADRLTATPPAGQVQKWVNGKFQSNNLPQMTDISIAGNGDLYGLAPGGKKQYKIVGGKVVQTYQDNSLDISLVHYRDGKLYGIGRKSSSENFRMWGVVNGKFMWMKHESIGIAWEGGTYFGINPDGSLWSFNMWKKQKIEKLNFPGKAKAIASGQGYLCVIDENSDLHFAFRPSKNLTANKTWYKVNGIKAEAVAVGVKGEMFVVTSDGSIYQNNLPNNPLYDFGPPKNINVLACNTSMGPVVGQYTMSNNKGQSTCECWNKADGNTVSVGKYNGQWVIFNGLNCDPGRKGISHFFNKTSGCDPTEDTCIVSQ